MSSLVRSAVRARAVLPALTQVSTGSKKSNTTASLFSRQASHVQQRTAHASPLVSAFATPKQTSVFSRQQVRALTTKNEGKDSTGTEYITKFLVAPSTEENKIPGKRLRELPVLETTPAIANAVKDVSTQKYHVAGPVIPGAADNADWASFAASWNRLALDKCMGDGGTYRYRRYATLGWRSSGQQLVVMPHMPLYQTIDANGLNGGKERWFEPVEESTLKNPVFQKIVQTAISVFTKREKELGNESDWFIEIDQFHIVANPGKAGNPTPEGIHTDGTDYFLALMVSRGNVSGGVTTIYNRKKEPLATLTLQGPSDGVYVNDREDTMHGVTPIQPLNEKPGHRDVMIVSFTNRLRPGSIENRFGK